MRDDFKAPSGLSVNEVQAGAAEGQREFERVLMQYRNIVAWIEDQANGAEGLVLRALGPQPQQDCGTSAERPIEGLVGEFDDVRHAAEAAMARLQDALTQLNSAF